MGLAARNEVRFAAGLPVLSEVTQELTRITGLPIERVQIDEAGHAWWLRSSRPAMGIQLVALEYLQVYYLVSDATSSRSHYLHESTLFVLLQLGGQERQQPQPWLGQPWQLVKKHWPPRYRNPSLFSRLLHRFGS